MSQQYEREIEEIIEREGGFLKGQDTPRPPRRRGSDPRGRSTLSRLLNRFSFTPARMMLGSLALALAALLLWNSTVPFLGGLLVIAAVTLFLTSYAISFIGSSRNIPEKRWRGQVIQPPPGSSWEDRLFRLFRRRW